MNAVAPEAACSVPTTNLLADLVSESPTILPYCLGSSRLRCPQMNSGLQLFFLIISGFFTRKHFATLYLPFGANAPRPDHFLFATVKPLLLEAEKSKTGKISNRGGQSRAQGQKLARHEVRFGPKNERLIKNIYNQHLRFFTSVR